MDEDLAAVFICALFIFKKIVLHCFCKCELNNYLTISDDRFQEVKGCDVS